MAIEKILGGSSMSPDTVGAAFNKVNNAFDEIITGVTYNSETSQLSLNKFDGSSFDVAITKNYSTTSASTYTVTRNVGVGDDVHIVVDLEISGSTTGDTITLLPQNFLNKTYFKLDKMIAVLTRKDNSGRHVGRLVFSNFTHNVVDSPQIFIKAENVGEYDYADDTVRIGSSAQDSLGRVDGLVYINDSGSFTLPDISAADMTMKHVGFNTPIDGSIKVIIKGFMI